MLVLKLLHMLFPLFHLCLSKAHLLHQHLENPSPLFHQVMVAAPPCMQPGDAERFLPPEHPNAPSPPAQPQKLLISPVLTKITKTQRLRVLLSTSTIKRRFIKVFYCTPLQGTSLPPETVINREKRLAESQVYGTWTGCSGACCSKKLLYIL